MPHPSQMKLWKKHRHNPEERLRRCLELEKKKSPYMETWNGYNDRVKEICKSAEPYLSRDRIREILLTVIND